MEKYILEQDTLLYWLRPSNVGKKCLSFSSSWEPLVPLSPSPGPWTPFSSLGTKDFLSTCLGIDALSNASAEPLLSIKIRTILGMATVKAMAPDSSTLARKIPGTGEPGGLQSMGSLRIRHNWATSLSLSCIGKEMATHSSILAWRISGTGEPGGLPSMGSHRVGHGWSDLAAVAAGMAKHQDKRTWNHHITLWI